MTIMAFVRAGLVVAAVIPGPVRALSVVDSKHDLSASSLGGGVHAQAGQTDEVCVFCHTPHRSSLNVPLWNHLQTGAAFTFYSSNNLTAKGFSVPGAGTLTGSRTKLCLGCHDGVTALGSLYNIGGAAGVVTMTGTIGSLNPGANLGTNLTDDHPVLYDMDTVKDTESLIPGAADAVKVYNGTNRVECTSCHNPHDPGTKAAQTWPFLVKANTDAAICKSCHAKTGFSTAIHDTSTVAYTPSGYYAGYPATTVGAWACRSCHKMHGANITPANQRYLLAGAEENTCFACHGSTPLAGTPNIQTPMGRASHHTTTTVSGVHLNPETDATNLGSAKRHAECQDCHDPHKMQARVGSVTYPEFKNPPSNLIMENLIGSWGVNPTWTGIPIGSSPTVYTVIPSMTTADQEYKLCMKCHSSYTTQAVAASNVAPDFNPAQGNKHPVWGAGANTYCTATTMVPPWNAGNTHSTMRCSDCHGSASLTDAYGPHGSAQARILKDSLIAISYGGTYATPFCLKCHAQAVYAGGSSNLSNFADHPGARGNHSLAPGAQGASTYGGCLICHGNFTPRGFHGESYNWAATAKTLASTSAHFMTNRTNFTGWEPGNCYANNAAGCNTSHDKTY